MQLRYATPALVLGLLAFRIAAPPATDRYSFEVTTESITDLTELGQGEMESNAILAGELSVTMAEDGALTIVLDTITGSSEGQGAQVTPELLAQVIGTQWTAVKDDKGRLTELVADSGSSQLASQLEGNLLRGLFPYVPAGAKVGDTWTDTLEYSNADESGSQSTSTAISYSVASDTTMNGIDALVIEAAYETSTTIYQEAQGGIDIEGTGTGTGTHYVTKDGKYLGGARSSDNELEVSGPQIPAIIPITAASTISVNLLP